MRFTFHGLKGEKAWQEPQQHTPRSHGGGVVLPFVPLRGSSRT